MKKLVLVIAFFVVFAFGVNAIEFSAGIGADVGFIFTSIDTNIPQPFLLNDKNMTRWGISAFLDAQYIEANLGFKFFVFSYSEGGSIYEEGYYIYEETDNFFNLGLKLKYPFQITETISIFPLVGFDYSIFTSLKAKDNTRSISIDRDDVLPSDAIDRFSINLGIGGDFFVGQNVFIRGEFNYTFLLNTETQKDMIDEAKSFGYNLSIFQSGPVFKLAIGYRF